jgi:uncharacterized DUF497 family protein
MKIPNLLWSREKDERLRRERGVSFEDVEESLIDTGALSDIPHPNKDKYPNQRIMVVEIRGEVYAVPYVGDDVTRFLKTIYPSRKARRIHGKTKASSRG